ncbi:phosphomannomutase [Oceanicoccus sagamiensis]|uniref:phosphomannomutase n=1 Tax=Oceanicoccus sagamiensis TaxID=716816 RepID=A0A1X9NDM3_9GAMM|nr:phosphomannomutase [Oceanicoccus sagamiensis]ARN74502.1 phosphomannomutase [Oceanicoccus sagamiensis]
MPTELTCFKAYDIRGRVPDELNADIAYAIGRAYAEVVKPKKVVVGHDIRLTSQEIKAAVSQGLMDAGVDVYDIGQCGTEEIYFATFHAEMDGGIAVTASHNPKDYNGMKFVREGSKPISGDTGLFDIKQLAEENNFPEVASKGQLFPLDSAQAYIEHLLSYVDAAALKPLKVVVNAGNGGAGAVIDRIESKLPFDFIKLHHEPDGHFPNGVPNPLLVENRQITIDAVKEHNADLGIAWDGDFDRCFFFDENGEFIEGYYVVGLLAEAFLLGSSGEKIVHDPRLTWNTIDIVESNGGAAVESKTGHAFIKERMRLENAVYGGEMSAHHYFRDFAYCDSGMIPWLLVTQLISNRGQTLSSMVAERMQAFPCSGEINRKIEDPAAAIANVEAHFAAEAKTVERVDGLSMSFGEWRFNLRMSNTEPVVRLNVESAQNPSLMNEKTELLLSMLNG